MLRGLVALVCFGLVAQLGCAVNQQRHKGLRHHAVHHKSYTQPVSQGWSLPPLSKIFRGSAKTVDALEDNMKKLKNAVRDLRGKNLEDAKEQYTGFTQALTVDDEQDQKLEVDNNEVEKKINALELSNKAEAQRRDSMITENAKLTKQLEELKKTVNAQVDGLEGILKNGVDVPKSEETTAPVATAAAPVQFQAVPQPEYCHCTKACTDLGWGEWCPVQSANCVTKLPCSTGGAANTCVTVDPQAGPWTRCANIMAPQAISLIQTSKKDSDEDDDEDSDDDDDSKVVQPAQAACACRTPCHDEGWGMWCYLQTANCRVKDQCEMGGAANACVASDPGGPWTRCSNLLSVAPAQPAQSPRIAPPAASQAQSYNVASPAIQQTFTSNANPVKDLLVKMMTQVDDIRTEDQQSTIKMQEIYQAETAKLQSTRSAIQERQTELAARLREVKGQSAKLAREVEHLEEVNRSLHTQLHRLEHFLSSASSELHGSIETEDRVASAALQMSSKSIKKDDDDDDDSDDDSDDKDEE
jgi:hypothetical protein